VSDTQAAAVWTIGDHRYAVRVFRVLTRNGERLRIERADGDAAVELDAIELESLTVEGLDLQAVLGLGE
jgi:hypothetical protein